MLYPLGGYQMHMTVKELVVRKYIRNQAGMII